MANLIDEELVMVNLVDGIVNEFGIRGWGRRDSSDKLVNV